MENANEENTAAVTKRNKQKRFMWRLCLILFSIVWGVLVAFVFSRIYFTDEKLVQVYVHGADKRARLITLFRPDLAQKRVMIKDFERTFFELAVEKGKLQTAELLLQYGAEVDARVAEGFTPLMWAAAHGKRPIINLLLDGGAKVNARGWHGEMPLHHAARGGKRRNMELLLSHGARLNASTAEPPWLTPLYLAVMCGREKSVAFLLHRGAELGCRPYYGAVGPVHGAALNNRPQLAQKLLEAGADVNEPDGMGRTPLWRTIQLPEDGAFGLIGPKCHVNVARVLLRHGASTDMHGPIGDTVLGRAVRVGNEEMVKMLIDHGVDVNASGRFGKTVLHIAAQENELKMAIILLKNGANINAKDNAGLTPVDFSIGWNAKTVAKLVRERGGLRGRPELNLKALRQAIIEGKSDDLENLLRKKGYVDVRSWEGRSLLHLAAERNEIPACKLLVGKGALLDAKGALGNTPLHLAEEKKAYEAASLLVELGADVNAQNEAGRTPLSLAVAGNTRHVKLLLLNGAEVGKRDKKGRTPLHYAIKSSASGQMLRILLSAGARADVWDKDGGNTPLHLAANSVYRTSPRTDISLLGTLLQSPNNPDVNVKNQIGETPLHLVGRKSTFRKTEKRPAKKIESARLLVENGANVNERNNVGFTPLDIAAQYGCKKLVNYLRRKGGKRGRSLQ